MSAVLQENRRAGLLYDFSVGEIHYDRNSHPRFIGDGMSNLTGSVAAIDHAAYGHIKGHQKVDDVDIKVNYDPVTNPPSYLRGLPRRPVVDAVRCAVAVQQAMPGRNTGLAAASAAKGEVFGRKHGLCDPREYPLVIIYYSTHSS